MDWDPPTDTPVEDISCYIMIMRKSVSGVRNEIRANSTRATFQLSQCTDNLLVSVSAVDRCGKEGLSSHVQPKPLQPENPATSANTSPACIGKLVGKLVTKDTT